MLQDNSSSHEIHSDILSSFMKSIKNDNTGNEVLPLQDTNKSKPPHIDIGCEPKSSRSKKSDSGCLEGDRAGSLHSPKLILSRSLISVISSSSMLEEPIPPSYHTLQSSQDTDGGTSMARHLTKVADSGAQDSNKFPSNIYNHNDSFKLTNKNITIIELDEEQEKKRSITPKDEIHIPINNIISVSDNYQDFGIAANYKRTWGIPVQCKLVGGGESTLNSNSTGPISNSASNSSPSGAGGSNNNNNNNNNNNSSSSSNWSAGHTSASTGVGSNAWSAGGNGNNSSNRQPVGSNTPSNNASHPSNTSQSTGKGGNNSGSQNQSTGQSQPTNTGATSWAQAAGKNLPPSSSAPNTSPGSNAATSTTANGSSVHNMNSPNGTNNNSNGNNNASKQQIEDFKSMRDSLFATDGWGGQHVNQDSVWDVPASPEPAAAKDGSNSTTTTAPWKPNVNNGTDLWEANLRNGGQPPPQTTQKTPWGHTPTTNIGGTWGEDDEGESSNVWSGSSPSVVANPGVQQWGSTPSNPAPMWGNNKKDEWGNTGSGWNDPRELPRAGNGMDPRGNMDSSHMRAVMDHRNISGDTMIRGDPRGISGRINGSNSADPMWAGPPPQQPPGPGPHHHVTPTGPPPGPPTQTSKMVPPGSAAGGNSKVAHWKEMGAVGASNLGRTGMQCPPGATLPQNRLNVSGLNSAAAAAVAAGIKPDPLWPHPNSRNGAWGENGPHDMNSTPWGEEKMAPWNEPNLTSWNSSQKPKTPMTPSGWTDGEVDPSSWGHVSKMGPKNLTKEIVWASKQFRILSEMNFKKDDIENALRASSMNLEDALEFLNATRAGSAVNNMDSWRRHDIDASPFDHTANQAYPSHRFNPQQQLPFAVPPGGNSGNNANTPNISSLNPAVVQKILTQQPPPQQTSIQSFNQTLRSTQNQPSAHQLRTLVQQIQMAVSAGYLNQQILNQPLAPATLILLNSLLQQIKTLQQLQQQASQQSMYAGGQPNKSGTYMTLTVKQQQCKQAIHALQNQIVATQTVYLKQQQQSPHNLGAPAQPQSGNVNDFFKTQDPLSILQANLNDLTLNKDPQAINASLQNQSKLSQWKLPTSMDKDDLNCGNEFSRAPGTTTKSTTASGSPNLNPLLVQTDSTWSNVSNRCDGWPESVNELTDNKDWGSPAATASNFTDLVPEFEPGKPWKGSQMKSVEDDPNITPGSVVRSPLLSLPTMKDPDIFNTTSNATTNYENNESNGVYSPLGKVNNGNNSVASKSGWGDVSTVAGPVSDLWAPKSRGPPPGLTTSKSSSQLVSGTTSNSNGWGSLGSPRWTNSQSPWMGSSWLLLRNLTPQIDGSTLKTLCMQHGPLNNFHLFLNHGIALAKYNSRDEASKAQGALNSCVLGNTTIFAESPVENDVHALLQQLNQQSTSGNNNWSRNSGNNQNKPMQNSASTGSIQTPSDAWSSNASTSQLWPSALWGTPQSGLETPDPHRATPSSLNSFLPGDLLGGESM